MIYSTGTEIFDTDSMEISKADVAAWTSPPKLVDAKRIGVIPVGRCVPYAAVSVLTAADMGYLLTTFIGCMGKGAFISVSERVNHQRAASVLDWQDGKIRYRCAVPYTKLAGHFHTGQEGEQSLLSGGMEINLERTLAFDELLDTVEMLALRRPNAYAQVGRAYTAGFAPRPHRGVAFVPIARVFGKPISGIGGRLVSYMDRHIQPKAAVDIWQNCFVIREFERLCGTEIQIVNAEAYNQYRHTHIRQQLL